MLQTYTSVPAGMALTADTAIPFNTNKILNGCMVRHTEGAANIYLKKSGIYKIDFNGIFVSSGESTPITVQMYNGGSAVADAKATQTSSSNTDYVNLNFTALVKVAPSCCAVDNTAILTFVNANADVMLLSNITVLKVE